MKRLLTWMILASTATAIAASPPSKPPWQWTIEERLAARFDDTARNRRIDAFEANRITGQARRRVATTATDGSRPTDVVHGRDHPELLLPFEIFSVFTQAAYGIEDETTIVIRRDAAKQAVALGLPANFLATLETEARTFIALQREESQLRRLISTGRLTELQRGMTRLHQIAALECPSRAEAIRNLRNRFGSRFDEFLYSAIAPGVSRDFFEPVSAQTLRGEEEGCR